MGIRRWPLVISLFLAACSDGADRAAEQVEPVAAFAEEAVSSSGSTTTLPHTQVENLAAPPSWRWSVGAEAPIVQRYQHVSVWSGRELIVWGGAGADDLRPRPLADGAAFDPIADRWRVLAESPLSPRAGALSTWTGEELVIVAGVADGAYQPSAAVYAPDADAWRLLPDLDPALWVADIVSNDRGTFVQSLGDLAWFRLDLDTGATTAIEGDPSVAQHDDPGLDREFHPYPMEPVWTGSEMLHATTEFSSGRSSTRWYRVEQGAPDVDLPLPVPPDGPTRWEFESAWTGDRLIVWGGTYCGPGTDCSFDGPTAPLILSRDPAVDSIVPAALSDAAGEWALVEMSLDGRTIHLDATPTLSFVDGQAIGDAGCPYAGPVTSYSTAGLFWNRWEPETCPNMVAGSDEVYRSALIRADTINIIETGPRRLWLRGPRVSLVFGASTAAPSDAEPSSGTASFDRGDVADSLDQARLRWATADLGEYRLVVSEHAGWSAGCAWTTDVSFGDPAPSQADSAGCGTSRWTVAVLHDVIDGMLREADEFARPGQDRFSVVFDNLGIPVSIDYDLAALDDEESSLQVDIAVGEPSQPSDPTG